MLGLAGILLSPSYLARVGAVLDDILQRGGISSLSTRGWYFNAHLLKHDFCSQFSRLADKETAEGRHLLSPSGITEPKFRAFSMTRSCRVNSSPPVEQFHFLFRSRGLGKRGILFPFPVHVSQRGGKYYFRFRWKFGGKGSTRDTEEGLLRQGPSRTRGDCGAAGLRLFYHYCHQSSTFGWTFQNLFMQHYISCKEYLLRWQNVARRNKHLNITFTDFENP